MVREYIEFNENVLWLLDRLVEKKKEPKTENLRRRVGTAISMTPKLIIWACADYLLKYKDLVEKEDVDAILKTDFLKDEFDVPKYIADIVNLIKSVFALECTPHERSELLKITARLIFLSEHYKNRKRHKTTA